MVNIINCTTMKFSIEDFFSKYDLSRSFKTSLFTYDAIDVVLVSLLLTLNMCHTLLYCLYFLL